MGLYLGPPLLCGNSNTQCLWQIENRKDWHYTACEGSWAGLPRPFGRMGAPLRVLEALSGQPFSLSCWNLERG